MTRYSWNRRRCASFIALTALASTATAIAAPEEFVIDSGHTFPTFEVRHLGIATQRGRFNRASGTVILDREAGMGSVDVTIDARSIDTGNESLDNLLRGPTFFDTGKFPNIRYQSSQAVLLEGQPSRVEGELTLLGITKPVTLNVSGFQCTRKPFLVVLRCGVDISATFRRSDFGMSAVKAFVSDEVMILIQAEAERKSQPAGELDDIR